MCEADTHQKALAEAPVAEAHLGHALGDRPVALEAVVEGDCVARLDLHGVGAVDRHERRGARHDEHALRSVAKRGRACASVRPKPTCADARSSVWPPRREPLSHMRSERHVREYEEHARVCGRAVRQVARLPL